MYRVEIVCNKAVQLQTDPFSRDPKVGHGKFYLGRHNFLELKKARSIIVMVIGHLIELLLK